MSRCVTCGYPKERHEAETLKCPGFEHARYGTRDLPAGKTCRDCAHIRFCTQFIAPDIADNTECDWFPVRFTWGPPKTATKTEPIPAGGKS